MIRQLRSEVSQLQLVLHRKDAEMQQKDARIAELENQLSVLTNSVSLRWPTISARTAQPVFHDIYNMLPKSWTVAFLRQITETRSVVVCFSCIEPCIAVSQTLTWMLRLKLLNSLTLAYVNSSLIKIWTKRQDSVPCVEMSVGAGNSLTRKHDDHTSWTVSATGHHL